MGVDNDSAADAHEEHWHIWKKMQLFLAERSRIEIITHIVMMMTMARAVYTLLLKELVPTIKSKYVKSARRGDRLWKDRINISKHL